MSLVPLCKIINVIIIYVQHILSLKITHLPVYNYHTTTLQLRKFCRVSQKSDATLIGSFVSEIQTWTVATVSIITCSSDNELFLFNLSSLFSEKRLFYAVFNQDLFSKDLLSCLLYIEFDLIYIYIYISDRKCGNLKKKKIVLPLNGKFTGKVLNSARRIKILNKVMKVVKLK